MSCSEKDGACKEIYDFLCLNWKDNVKHFVEITEASVAERRQ